MANHIFKKVADVMILKPFTITAHVGIAAPRTYFGQFQSILEVLRSILIQPHQKELLWHLK